MQARWFRHHCMSRSFLLGRQTLLEQSGFERNEIGGRILPKASLLSACLLAELKGVAEAGPAFQVRVAQMVLVEEGEAAGVGREHADRPAHDGGGGGAETPAGAALVIAGGAEVLLEVIVRPGQTWDVVGVEQAGPVAGADLEEVSNGRLERAD